MASTASLHVNGIALLCVDSVMDPGYAVSSNNKDSMVTASKASLLAYFLIYSCLIWTHIHV